MKVRGINIATISQGKVVYQDGDVRTERGVGRYVNRPTYASYYDAIEKRAQHKRPSAVQRK